ncbi:sn-glycerol-3-phosphate import ATP-binding protein UgpC [Marinomonas gallaica]|uniref:sn-glycerol-3-phosphate import ATP-binding protein UgpC n=1 Tax=Marinomonas gallaica TaxID=1806667 RepID=A0A1C3JLK5_9GAMM|nr:sn-glycerol-3-phosphate import ATP-binding protein UgpC [Marinomonas gallaica]SBT15977.1 sn-glycerol-3-phosphate import ATP-binding protein UgpC [Marinomonas gallaica]SBT21025.1 sn-glycerol-3-phosphate import ATP-binding protein UgpC [Marinomonas gallaica]
MSDLVLRNIGKTYANGYQAIPSIDLTIEEGEFIVLVGPSGCGKSTLLRMVAGLESISQGDLLIKGDQVNHKEPAERDIAMVFQNYALYPHMSVYDNMAYGLKNRGEPKSEIETKVNAVAQMLGLEELLTRKPRQLSGGQRQRVAMGRAMVRDPKVFLFDEPLSNLDAKLRVQMRVEIRELQRKLGTTTLYVTHDQVEAMTLADRLVVLNKGHAEQVGTPMALYERPASTFVAQFIGSPSMNLIPSSIENGVLQLGVDSQLACPQFSTDKVMWGIRPEHVDIVPLQDADLSLQVKAVEALGAETLIHGSVKISEDKQYPFVVRLSGNHAPDIGQPIGLRVPQQAWHVFDAETTKRIEPL